MVDLAPNPKLANVDNNISSSDNDEVEPIVRNKRKNRKPVKIEESEDEKNNSSANDDDQVENVLPKR